MLLSLSHLINTFNLKIKGVIHIGAHYGEEYQDYVKHGIKPIVFIEPCKDAFSVLKQKFEHNSNVLLFNTACGNYNGVTTIFTETKNKGQSNSILSPKLHLTHYKDIVFEDFETVVICKVDFLDFNRSAYNFINIDVQGYEGNVLKGATDTLKSIDYIYAEVNKEELYTGCTMVEELDEILSDFDRVVTKFTNAGWGDALYIRKSLL